MGKQRRKENKMKKYTLKEIKKLWHFAYNEDLAKEYKGFFKLLKRKDNSCNECNENCSTLNLKYNDKVYWLCDDCYVEYLKKDKIIERTI